MSSLKRITAIFLLVVLALTACNVKPKGSEIQYVEKNGEILFATYHYDEQTISVGSTPVSVYGPDGELIFEEDRKDQYRYEYDNGSITIIYPNGATYWESATESGAVISWDDHYDPERYVDGATLARQIAEAYNTPRNYDDVVIAGFCCLIIAGIGFVQIRYPELLFQWRYSLWLRNVEPTEFALGATRIAGVIAVVGAVIMFAVVAFG